MAEHVCNVIVFGETGAGKSSVLNMLEGDTVAEVSDKARGVTFQNQCFQKIIQGAKFRIFDTVGLNEGVAGTVAPRDAIEGLYSLMRQLGDGVDLLVYVMRAPRITKIARENYEVFHDMFCDKQVPIVIIITGLEDRECMDGWWDENKTKFDSYGMKFDGFACITATRGKLKDGVHVYSNEYDRSTMKVEELIKSNCKKEPWKMPSKTWFSAVIIRMCNTLTTVLGFEPVMLSRELTRALQSYGGLSPRQAKVHAWEIEKHAIPKWRRGAVMGLRNLLNESSLSISSNRSEEPDDKPSSQKLRGKQRSGRRPTR